MIFKMKYFYAVILFLYAPSLIFSQSGFQFLGNNTDEVQVRFQLINNLIVIPLELNHKKLSFILDTGVNKTILFNLSQTDSLTLNQIEKIKLKGLGDDEAVDALLSKTNQLKIKNLYSYNHSIYVLLNNKFDLSSRMGITINGIIGYDLLKNLIVKINYKSKVINFYNPKTYKYRKCRRCDVLPLQFYRKKPFIDASVQLDTMGATTIPLKMLLDSGSSDAIWLFEFTKKQIKTPQLYFNDILGDGLSGAIYGNRSRVPKISIGKFSLKAPTVAFLDTLSTITARSFKQRNGSIGGAILRRFKIWIDYPNKKMTFKKNGSFTKNFNYNMSGLDVVYSGQQLVKEQNDVFVNNPFAAKNNSDDNFTIAMVTSYRYQFKPAYKINKVTLNSSGARAGIQKEDVLIKLNGEFVYNYSLQDIVNIFQEKDRKKIRLLIDRQGVEMYFEFRLEKRI